MRYETWNLKVPGQAEGEASLTAYLLDTISVAPGKRRPAVIVIPGGGYSRRSDREREPVAMRFLAMGYHALILDYSVSPSRFPVSLRELALAVALVREHAEEWHVDPEGIFVCGFSAGGHLACSLGTYWQDPLAWEAVGKTAEAVRPSGLILCYPVITAGEYCHPGSFVELLGPDALQEARDAASLELHVTGQMPPVFLWHTVEDGSVPVENSLLLASALRKSGVEFELHIYPHGVHGLSLANEETGGARPELIVPGCQTWISLVQSWIENRIGGQTLV